jgi:NADH-quinone oxidoreductase subunit C
MKEIILETLKSKLGSGVILETEEFKDEFCIIVDKANIAAVCKTLKESPELDFNMCIDVTAIDWSRRKNRFTVVYHIYSMKNKYRLRIKADVDAGDLKIDTVTHIWPSANWYERETFDMYGIHFSGHPDLRRMYMPEEFEYYPLRKEFPVMGIPGSLSLPKK